MSEQSRFWISNNQGDGSSTGANENEIAEFFRKAFIGDQEASQGVLKHVDNELEVTGVATPLQLDTGAAIVYGFFYENTAALNLNVSTPAVGTTGGRVNLKVDWAAQTVRAEVVLSADGDPTIPALSQIAETEWELPLYTFTVTTSDVITLTDVRTFARMSFEVPESLMPTIDALSIAGRSANTVGVLAAIIAASDGQVLRRSGASIGFGQIATGGIANDAVTQGKIADNAIDTAQILNDAVTEDKIATGGVGEVDINDGDVEEDQLGNLAVTLNKFGNDAVDDTKVGNRVPQIYRRQGGDASEWNTAGSNNYTPTTARMQTGAKVVKSVESITFPQAFSAKPLVVASAKYPPSEWEYLADISGRRIYSLVEMAGFLYAGTSEGHIYRSNDGINWTEVYATGEGNPIYALYLWGGYIYAGGGNIWRSSNGTTWTKVCSLTYSIITSFCEYGIYLYACGSNEYDNPMIYRSNNGTSWSAINDWDYFYNMVGGHGHFTNIKSQGSYLYASSNYRYIIYSTDGINFSVLISGAIGKYVEVNGMTVWNGYVWVADERSSPPGYIIRILDDTYSTIFTATYNIDCLFGFDNLYAGLPFYTIYVSSDGANWNSLYWNFPVGYSVMALGTLGTDLYCATYKITSPSGSKIFRLPLPEAFTFVKICNVSASGFDVEIMNVNTTPLADIYWMAIGPE